MALPPGFYARVRWAEQAMGTAICGKPVLGTCLARPNGRRAAANPNHAIESRARGAAISPFEIPFVLDQSLTRTAAPAPARKRPDLHKMELIFADGRGRLEN